MILQTTIREGIGMNRYTLDLTKPPTRSRVVLMTDPSVLMNEHGGYEHSRVNAVMGLSGWPQWDGVPSWVVISDQPGHTVLASLLAPLMDYAPTAGLELHVSVRLPEDQSRLMTCGRDGDPLGLVDIYGSEFWPDGETPYLYYALGPLKVYYDIELPNLEGALGAGLVGHFHREIVVVRPSNKAPGFSARGYLLEREDQYLAKAS
jgi:hypothetical protein